MKRVQDLSGLFAAGVVVFGIGLSAHAGNTVVYPNSVGVSNVAGNSTTSAPGFETGSFQAPGVGGKSEIYIAASSLFAGPVTIGDIASLSYFTNKSGDSNSVDWSFYIYTAQQATGDTGSFYHTRLTSEPLYTNTPNAADLPGSWHQWSTNDPLNPMRFYDAPRTGVQGTNSDPTLAQIQASTSPNYSSEAINLFSFQTGSSWANGFTGLLDGFRVTLNNGDFATVNFEAGPSVAAVPEPSTIAMAFTGGIIGVGAFLRRRRTATAV